MRPKQISPLGGVDRCVLVIWRFFGHINTDFHQQPERLLVLGGKLFRCKPKIFLQFFWFKVIQLFWRNHLLDERAIGRTEENGHGCSTDEEKDEENHQDGRRRDNEDGLLGEPFQRPGLMPALQANPADTPIIMMLMI